MTKQSVLVIGPACCGKTSYAKVFCQFFGLNVIWDSYGEVPWRSLCRPIPATGVLALTSLDNDEVREKARAARVMTFDEAVALIPESEGGMSPASTPTETVEVRIEVVETTRYCRTVPMTRAELARYRGLLGTDAGDDDAKRDVADLMFSRFVDRNDDECQELGLEVVLTVAPGVAASEVF